MTNDSNDLFRFNPFEGMRMTLEIQEQVRALDPFGFLVGQSSAITPLGGADRSRDSRYAFHTPYIDFQPGRVVFRIRLRGLRASFGELRVDINAFIPESGRDAIFVTSARLDLSDTAAVARGLTISFMCVAGATYAAYGYCPQGTDARAEALEIEAEQLETIDPASVQRPLLPSKYGGAQMETPSRLIASEPPSFAHPVSQAMTPSQLEESDFALWSGLLGNRNATTEIRWRLAFAAQALRSYGMLVPGARGLCCGDEFRALAPIFAEAGSNVLLADTSVDMEGAAASQGALACRNLDSTPESPAFLLSLANEAPDQRGFDFMLTLDIANESYAQGSSATALLEMMSVLRPRGVAIHMLRLAGAAATNVGALPRKEVERLAVTLLSRGFSVAQLNFDGTSDGDRPFGLIVRRD